MPSILEDAKLAYTDGIFLGLNDNCRAAGLEFIRVAKRHNCTFCFDMNYRESIWDPAQARAVYQEALVSTDVLVTSLTITETMFGFHGTDEELALYYRNTFGCPTVCVTSRQAHGTFRGAWRSLVLHKEAIVYGNPVEFEVVDRFGTGDAFFAGFLYGYLQGDVALGVNFGNCLCALAHTIEGDVALVTVREVMSLLQGGYDARLRR